MNGLITVAFGKKFDDISCKTMGYSRQFTDLPITVITNIPANERNEKWVDISDINFVYINDVQENNRQYKTTVIDYSPYDKTIYIDADALIQKEGIEKAFDKLDGNDLMLNLYGRWDKVHLSFYRLAMSLCNVTVPITVYYGAFIGFTKTECARCFFKCWNKNWRRSGIEREMPALAITVKKFKDLKLVTTKDTDKIFTWLIRDGYVIQHEYGDEFWRKFFD